MARIRGRIVAHLIHGVLTLTCLCVYIRGVHIQVRPNEGHFLCSDRSINFTSGYLETVPAVTAAGINWAIVFFTVVAFEIFSPYAIADRTMKQNSADTGYTGCNKCANSIISIARILFLALFGELITEAITVTVKKAVGRRRPYFLSVCVLSPEVKKLCLAGKLTKVSECLRTTPEAEKHLLEAIQSFPSGHSSHVMYMTVFAALYLQYRFPFDTGRPIKWLLQAIYMLWGAYVSYSRVADYRHHWGDVIVGGLGGTVIALLVCLQLRPKYLDGERDGIICDQFDEAAASPCAVESPRMLRV